MKRSHPVPTCIRSFIAIVACLGPCALIMASYYGVTIPWYTGTAVTVFAVFVAAWAFNRPAPLAKIASKAVRRLVRSSRNPSQVLEPAALISDNQQ